jgi:hypothetical protein
MQPRLELDSRKGTGPTCRRLQELETHRGVGERQDADASTQSGLSQIRARRLAVEVGYVQAHSPRMNLVRHSSCRSNGKGKRLDEMSERPGTGTYEGQKRERYFAIRGPWMRQRSTRPFWTASEWDRHLRWFPRTNGLCVSCALRCVACSGRCERCQLREKKRVERAALPHHWLGGSALAGG